MSHQSTSQRLTLAKETLKKIGQDHVFHFVHQLDSNQVDNLLTQIEGIDWPEVTRLIESHVKNKPSLKLPDYIEPVESLPPTPTPQLQTKYEQARLLGEKLIREGKIAAFTVAGGQGTRLGWPGPKGTFPATPIQKLPLFACFAQYLQKIEQKYNTACPWYIMTSTTNDQPTRAYFQEHDYFGLIPANVHFFTQGMMPAIDHETGKVLLASPSSLALSPNGHGGSLKALYTSGAIDQMKKQGIQQISYFQVDNPLVKAIDPLFIGLHAIDDCQMSSKMLPKAFPKEKLGNFCLVDGHVTVIEYSDLPDELAHQRLTGGELRFRAGSIAIHAINVNFVESLNTSVNVANGPDPDQEKGKFALPYHRAEKKVSYIDLESGNMIDPDTPNAIKLESFVFDALPICQQSIVFETQRVEEFAPIKNAEGTDSIETSHQLQTERAARWLETCGVKIPRNSNGIVNAVIEINPLTAIEPADLKTVEVPPSIPPGTEVLL